MNNSHIKKGYTHAGVFHADDVFSAAFLKLLNPDIVIERVFKAPETVVEDEIVFDIGLGEFDHHQNNNERRDNGVPYAAFGKLWRKFSSQLGLSRKSLDKIENQLVQPIDSTDNTGIINPLSSGVFFFNPEWNEEVTPDVAFEKATSFASEIIKGYIKHFKAVEAAESEVLEAAAEAEDGIVILKRFAPQDALQNVPEAKFVVYPSIRGGYNIQTIPILPSSKEGRIPFPTRWLGNPDKNLGMTFCHPGNFIAAAETLEQAIEIARIAIKEG